MTNATAMSQAQIAALANSAAEEAVDSLLTTLDADSFDCEQLQDELATYLTLRLQSQVCDRVDD